MEDYQKCSVLCCVLQCTVVHSDKYTHMSSFYPRDAMLARVFAIATCPSVCLSVCLSVRLSHAGIVTSRAKAGS